MAVAWSPGGDFLAASAGENLYLYAADNWEQKTALHVGAFTHGLAFSPDGRWLAAGSRDGMLRVWEVASRGKKDVGGDQPFLSIQAHKKGVNTLAFSPDGQLIATGGNDAVARLWEVPSGKLKSVMIGGTFAVPGIAFSPDGANLAIVNGDLIRIRQVGTERIVGTYRSENPLYSVAFSPDSGLLAASDMANRVLLWDPGTAFRTGQEKYPPPFELLGHAGKPGTYRALIWRAVFSPDGLWLASAGGDATVRLWDVANRQLLITSSGNTAGVTCVAFRPDSRGLASGSLDATLRVWELRQK